MATTKKTGKRSRTKAKARPTVYACKGCGKIAKGSGHLCSPVKADKLVECGFCGKTAGDSAHVCLPMKSEFKFYCGQCGRATPFRGAVCQPREIR